VHAKLGADDRHRIGSHLAGSDRVAGRFGRLLDPVDDRVVVGSVGARGGLGQKQGRHRRRGHDRASDADRFDGQLRVWRAMRIALTVSSASGDDDDRKLKLIAAGRRGIKGAVIYDGGFAEQDDEGRRL
jgi:hypothetical protein